MVERLKAISDPLYTLATLENKIAQLKATVVPLPPGPTTDEAREKIRGLEALVDETFDPMRDGMARCGRR